MGNDTVVMRKDELPMQYANRGRVESSKRAKKRKPSLKAGVAWASPRRNQGCLDIEFIRNKSGL